MRTASLFHHEEKLTGHFRICENFLERGRGLLFRPPLTKNAGDALLIPKCNSIHTFWMAYSIDVIFLSSEKKVMAIHYNLGARRVINQKKAAYALEVAAGNLWASQIKVGDILDWR